MDEYSKLHHRKSPAVITGKPVPLGGSLGREDATGRGAYICIKELQQLRNWSVPDTRVAIQGFGNAGQHLARLLHQDGYRVVAVSDSQGGAFRSQSLNIPKIIEEKNRERTLSGVYCQGGVCHCDACQWEGTERITNQELLELDVEVLIPAALENQITVENANSIKAPVVVEVANGPVAPEADRVLNDRNILVVPDILANAGGGDSQLLRVAAESDGQFMVGVRSAWAIG